MIIDFPQKEEKKIGYKVFDRKWCSIHGSDDFYNKPFEMGVVYEENEPPKVHSNGFHYCENLEICFQVYSPDSRNRIGEIEILGEIDKRENGYCATNKFKILREVPWREVAQMI